MIHLEKAKIFLEKNQPELALERLRNILRENNFSEEWRIHELIGLCFHDMADAEGAVQAYLNAAQTDTILRSQREHFSNFLFASHYLNIDLETLFENAKIYNSLYRDTEILPEKNFANKKIHVAYIAPHFLDSSSARFYESLLTEYDREDFFVSAWSLSNREDNFTKKIRHNVDKFFSFEEINFYKIAEKIQSENADILFDLGGHSEGGETLQILAYRPAKIQICGIGYFDTTGTNFVDYFFADKFLIGENKFTEKIFEVENAFVFKPNEKMISAKENLKNFPHKNFTFGCLNNFMKISDDYLKCVKKILDSVENSKIIFRDTTPLESRKKNLEKEILSAGIKNFEVRKGEDNFFNDYTEIDLILDTFHYGGGMMTALALYFCVPVLNLCGKNFCERIGTEIILNYGLENFVAKNFDEYIEKAINFSAEKNFIIEEKNISTQDFVKNVEENFLNCFYKTTKK